MQLRSYQQFEMVEPVRQAFREKARRVLLTAPTGAGKCLARGTPVIMSDGSIRPVESVKVGDCLMGPDSTPRRVLSLASGKEEMFRVTPTKGDAYMVNRSHILSLRMTGNKGRTQCAGVSYEPGEVANVTVDEYLSASPTFRHCAKGWRVGVSFPTKDTSQVLPPYILGTWLGDGDSGRTSLTSQDHEIISEWNRLALQLGMQFREERTEGRCARFCIGATRKQCGRGKQPNEVRNELRRLDLLNNKHIPDDYKINSEWVRLEVLAGLIDTDGSLSNGTFDYVSKVERLADDVCFLARSLGLAAYKTNCRKKCGNNGVVGDYFRVCISGDISRVPCRLPRKRADLRKQVKCVLNVGIKVESVGMGEYYGFEIDGNRLFLLGDFTVTHNTAVFSHIVAAAQAKGNGSWVMVHRDLLVRQASKSLTNWGCPHGVLSAGGEHDGQGVQVVSIQTLSSRLKKGWIPPPPKLLISDEAHHACSSSWLSVFDYFKDVPTLGVTATPCRLDGKGLGAVFDRLVLGPTTARLMDEGYLVRPQYWGVPPSQLPDLSQVGTDMGDFNKAALAKAVEDKPKLTGDVVAHYKRRADGLKFVGFACNIKHANTLRDAFVAAGIPCEVIHGGLSDDERGDMVGRLERGEIRGLWSVDLISEGFDLPEVSCAICCRPTKSLSLWLQQLGRVLRLYEGKTFAVILDHAGNLMRDGLGAAEEIREFTLEGVKKSNRDAESLPAICQCPKCFAVFLRADTCPRCEYVFPVVERKIKAVAGNLKQLSASDIEDAQKRMKQLREQGTADSLESLTRVGRARGMANPEGWARHVIEAREAKKAKEAIDKQLLARGRKIG